MISLTDFPVLEALRHTTDVLMEVLHLGGFDLSIIGIVIALALVFAIAGTARAYQLLFWAALGTGIYLVMVVLFTAKFWGEWSAFFGETTRIVAVGSAAYLPILMALLMFSNPGFDLSRTSDKALRGIESVLVGLLGVAFIICISTGLAEKRPPFDTPNGFSALTKEATWYQNTYKPSKTHDLAVRSMQGVIAFSLLFIIYQAVFADVVQAMGASIMAQVRRKTGGEGGGHDAHHETHGGHDEDMFDEHAHH